MEAVPVNPAEIYEFLKQDVIGQDDVLRYVAVSITKHLLGEKFGNLLLIGNSGTGKTSIMKALERFYKERKDLKDFQTVLRINANILYAEGEETFPGQRLFREIKELVTSRLAPEELTASRVQKLMERATICIDEIDKISSLLGNRPYPPGIAIQQSLLTLMEGEKVFYDLVLQGKKETLEIDTSKMLFICAGAFEKLYDLVFYRAVVKDKENTTRVNIGEDGQVSFEYRFSLKEFMKQEDLFEYGMLPQFISRFDSILVLNDLSEKDLAYIFTYPKDSLYRLSARYFEKYNVALTITDQARQLIAREAAKYKRIGARALKDVYSKVIKAYEFSPLSSSEIRTHSGKKELIIDEEVVRKKLNLEQEP